jgi:hypothetical protein
MMRYSRRAVRRLGLATSVLVLSLGCDAAELVEPVDNLTSNATSGTTGKAPSNLTAVVYSEGRIDVRWNDNSSNESAFEVHVSATGATGVYNPISYLAPNTTAFEDVYVRGGTRYCYKARSVRTSGRYGASVSYSDFSNVACDTTPISAASGVSSSPVGSTTIFVAWTDNSTREAGFRVERSLDRGATWTTAVSAEPEYTYAYDTGRAGDQEVCYRVIAFGGTNDARPSNTHCSTPIKAPTDLSATLINPELGDVELTWTDNSAVEDGYEIWIYFIGDVYGGDGYGYWVALPQLPANSTRFTAPGVGAGPFLVRATKDGGYSDFSNEVQIPQ